MGKDISFIHCADLHLDSPFKGLSNLPAHLFDEVRNSTFLALEKLVQTAIERRVDFVLMVGDIFDQEEQSMKAHIALVRAFKTLQNYNISVYLSFGNHDYINSQTFSRNYPSNVFVFEKDVVEAYHYRKDEEILATIYGFSYIERAVDIDKSREFIKTGNASYHIAMLHGSLGASESKDHANYAPFQLSRLKESGFDYWALGHIHQREHLSNQPPIIYPGNMQGRSIKERGIKGCYHVILTGDQSRLEFCPLGQIRFERLDIDTTNWTDIADATEQLVTVIRRHCNKLGKVFLEIEWTNTTEMFEVWQRQGLITDMIEIINSTLIDQENWVQIISVKSKQPASFHEWHHGEQFLEQLVATFEDSNHTMTLLSSLWQHPEGRKWLKNLSDQEQEDLNEQAMEKVYQMLHEREV